ncbi:MAG: preprotein translocase subunit SecE [Rhabdochlamydiaceae bacterium]|jgi:preprotein translocase subunit SecE
MSVKVEQLGPQVEPVERVSRISYIRELKAELKKVTWTTKEELMLSTRVVIGATFVFGMGIYFSDLLIKGFLDAFSAIIHLVFG